MTPGKIFLRDGRVFVSPTSYKMPDVPSGPSDIEIHYLSVRDAMKPGWSGTQEVRWYSGSTATWQPFAAALRISDSAFAKFAAGSTG